MQGTNNRSGRRTIVFAILLVAVLLAALLAGQLLLGPRARAQRALTLGQQYLQQGDYRQAVLQLQKAIDITQAHPEWGPAADPTPLLTDALQKGAAEKSQQQDLPAAGEWLDDLGYRTLPAFEPLVRLTELLRQLHDACEREEYDTAYGIMTDPDFQSAARHMLDLGFAPRLLDENTGLMTAVYPMEVPTENFEDTPFMLYHGGHDTDRERAGQGVWLGYQNGNNYLATGTWADDAPNGSFETRSWQASLAEGMIYRVLIGDVVDGLWEGRVTWRFEFEDLTEESYPSFSGGQWQTIGQEKDYYIASRDGDYTLTVTGEQLALTNGIAGYAQAA